LENPPGTASDGEDGTGPRAEGAFVRIVSLLPSATEILFAIGAGDDVVGVTHECDYPSEASRLPKTTSSSGPDLEDPAEIDRHVRAAMHAGSSLYALDSRLLERLAPDLIITQELCPVCAVSYENVARAATRLRSDPRIISLEPSSLEDVLANIALLGEVTGREERARQVVQELRLRVLRLRSASPRFAQPFDCGAARRAEDDKGRVSTLVLEWTDPPMSGGHWIPELVELAGGAPILAHPGQNSRRLEWDAIAAADPHAVVVALCGFDLDKTKRAIAALDGVEQWRSLSARRSGRVLAMDGNAYLSRPGPRLVEAAEIIARWYTTVAEYAG
jgi:iron complex transport system substrate-binding protein